MDRYDELLRTDVYGIAVNKASVAHIHLTKEKACALDADGILDGGLTSSTAVTVFEADDLLKQPPYARTITVIASDDTAAHVKNESTCTIVGTNIANQLISEVLTFEADQATAEETTKAFASIISITFSIMDGAAKFDVGWGDKLALPFILAAKPLVFAMQANAIETTAPVITVDDDEIEKNVIDLYTALHNDKAVDIYLFL